jgi:nitrite reductase/ring-hydroxylating ferredoxin subunit
MAAPERRVCRVEELPPGSVKLVPLGRFGIGVYNVNGRYYGLANYCPHRGGPLCLGRITGLVEAGPRPYELLWSRSGEFLRCPWHGIEFEIATGRSIITPMLTVKSYQVRVSDGVVLLEDA